MKKHLRLVRCCIVQFMIIILVIFSINYLPNLKGLKKILMSIEVEAAEVLNNPRIVKDDSMEAGQKVTWDCVYFGSYPQTEVVLEGSKEEASIKQMAENYDPTYKISYEVVDSAAFEDIQNASYDDNGDAIVNGTKYRRLKGEDALFMEFYKWSDTTTYHYYKYQPIKWRVLSVNGNEAFLLADAPLDFQFYNLTGKDVIWETSTIRSWLNGYDGECNVENKDYSNQNFINCAFSGEEQTAIITKEIENEDYWHNKQNNTADKVFLLSREEVQSDKAVSYGFGNDLDVHDEARRAQATIYAFAMGACVSNNGTFTSSDWWLRTTGDTKQNVAAVSIVGNIADRGIATYLSNVSVRPALYLDLSNTDLYTLAGTVCSDEMARKEIPFEHHGTENTPNIDAGEATSSTNNTKNNSQTEVSVPANIAASVGSILTDSSSKSRYIVAEDKSTVVYKAPLNKKVKKITIPSTVTISGVTYKVTSIAPNAFKKCKKLKKIAIGANVAAIGKNAFSGCKNLKNVIIKSKSLKTIGKNAFKGINKKAKIKVPKKNLKKYIKMLKKSKLNKGIKITK